MLTHVNMDDINHKYAKSIIFYDGQPVICDGGVNLREGDKYYVGVQFQVIGLGFGAANAKSFPATDPKFTDGPFNIGYINGVASISDEGDPIHTVVFCSRMPIRRWKQGLTTENMYFQNGMTFNKALKHQGFIDMLTGKYPSFKQAWATLDDNIKRVAYHRHWAVGQNKLDHAELYYRGKLVGTDKAMKNLAPSDKFAYLNESFELSRAI